MLRHQRYRGDLLLREFLGREHQSYGTTVNLMGAEYRTFLAGAIAKEENVSLGDRRKKRQERMPRRCTPRSPIRLLKKGSRVRLAGKTENN
jgi:hypothetical protein